MDLQLPIALKELWSFLGIVWFYGDMWKQYSHIIASLVDLVGLGKRKLKWNPNHQKSFEEIKRVSAKETILNHPRFGGPFDIHTNASDRKLGTVISQDANHKHSTPGSEVVHKEIIPLLNKNCPKLWKPQRDLETSDGITGDQSGGILGGLYVSQLWW